MRWKASRPELIWRREFTTRTGALLHAVPRTICWLTLLGAYAGLMAVLYVPKVPLFDILSPFATHFLGVAASAVAALVASRRHILILGAGTTLTVLGHSLPAWMPDRPLETVSPIGQANASAGAAVKVMAFNLWDRNRDLGLAMRTIASSGADVVLLSEVTAEARQALDSIRDVYPHVVLCDPFRPCDQGLISKLPFAASGAEPPRAERPTMAWARLAGPGVAAGLTVVSTHITRPTRSFKRHASQREGLIRELAKIDGPLVIGGDLNVTRGTRSFQDLVRQAELSGTSRLLPSWPAYPLVLPQFGIDHILVRGAVTVLDAGVAGYGGSDHLPVWSTISAATDRSRQH